MNPTINELDQISRTLDSLIEIKEYDKYGYSPNDKLFYKSGAPIVDFVSYVWGKGYTTQFVQGCSRSVSGESYVSFANGLKTLESDLKDVIDTVRGEVLSPEDSGIKAFGLNRLIGRVNDVCERLGKAGAGLTLLINSSYEGQEDKRKEINPYIEKLQGGLLERVQQLYIDLVRKRTRKEMKIVEEEEKDSSDDELKEWCLLAEDYEKKIRLAELRRIQEEKERINNQKNPETGLSNNDLKMIKEILFGKEYGPKFRHKLKKLIKVSQRDPSIYIRPEVSKFHLPVQYYINRLVIHLKKLGEDMFVGEGRHKIVTKSVIFNGAADMVGTVCANGVSKLTSKEKRQVADNERKYLEMFKGKPGILPVISVSRYPATDGKALKQSVLMPYCHHGELARYIEEKHVSLSDKQKLKILFDVAEGLITIHEVAVHQDIKPGNILLKNDLSGAWIADFGICREIHNKQHIGGTDSYMAPEVMRIVVESRRDPKEFKERGMDLEEAKKIKSAIINKLRNAPSTQSDIWSLGCTGWLLMTGEKTPYTKAKDRLGFVPELMDVYMDENALPEAPEGTVLHLLRRMMHPNPHERPTALEVQIELKNLLN